ncbi:EAL domain-containing protein [Bacillus salitolerans]|uniref:EAL domain-containing protein n=1 Tax=Bacillus salitolerans TaxID=1437434 RepID=A0ABW4LSW6_9BACI
MPQRFWESINKQVSKWSKLFLARKYLRFYPPSFVLRNPILEGVQASFRNGQQIAVIVFNISNLQNLIEQFGISHCKQYQLFVRQALQDSVVKVFPNQNILSLHNYSSNGIALIVQFPESKKGFIDLEISINDIMSKLDILHHHSNIDMPVQLNTGYMFIEEIEASAEDAIDRAYRQADAMAEKRIHSKYNELVFEMTRIIKNKDVELLAQPIIDVSSNQIKAWEILSRGPKGTSLESPLQLFSVARQTNRLFNLEMIVLEQAFEQIIKTGCPHLVFINLTPISLGNPEILKSMKKLLTKYRQVDPYKIILEITERDSIQGYKHFVENIQSLRSMGFRIAVDDTGAGYASLHTISEVLPDIIKIDRSVIQNIDTCTVKESMLKGLLLIAKETGSIVVAEGIEKEGEASVLSRNNVDLAQGYFYAKPDALPSMVSSF